MNMKKISLIVPFLFIFTGIWAQQTPLANGGVNVADNDTVVFAIGQSIGIVTDDEATVSSGTIQPYEILEVSTALEDVLGDIQLKIYPNPTTDNLILQFVDQAQADMQYNLYDITGKLLKQGVISSDETVIPTFSLVPGEYLLVVSGNNKRVKTFKIIKK